MPLSLALVQPPSMYDVSPPATYEEAGQLLYSSGRVMADVVESQPPQKTFAQTLTAQTLKELAQGWTSIFSVMAADPASPQPGSARFQWNPGGTLVVDLPSQSVGQEVCDGMEGVFRAATWRQVMKAGDGMLLSELLGQFEIRYQSNLEAGAGSAMADAVSDLVVEFYDALFRFEGGGPLLTDLEIQWGAADECLAPLAAEYRANRR